VSTGSTTSKHYKITTDFDQRFPAGAPSLKEARSLVVKGDWILKAGVHVIGEVTLEDHGAPQIIAAGSTLSNEAASAAGCVDQTSSARADR
jgi:UTP--glucose-1-phosphate uridylyltransferase